MIRKIVVKLVIGTLFCGSCTQVLAEQRMVIVDGQLHVTDDEAGKTAKSANNSEIHKAVSNGDVERVATLLNDDSKLVGARNADGHTPLEEIAYTRKITTVFSNVRSNLTAEMKQDVKSIDDPNALAIAKLLMEHGAEITGRDGSLLLSAAFNNNKGLAELFLSKGVNPNVTHRETGLTPLMVAASWRFADVVSVLLEYGADTTLKDNNNKTASDLTSSYEMKTLINSKPKRKYPEGLGGTSTTVFVLGGILGLAGLAGWWVVRRRNRCKQDCGAKSEEAAIDCG